jgi:hypothetical protein
MTTIRHLVFSFVFFTAAGLSAQVPLIRPMESQLSTISQRIDFTDITVTYSSPGAKGRKVFGTNLVPFGKVWRAGANDNTVISFSSAVAVEGKSLAAGSYGLHVIPEADTWTFIFSSKTGDWGSYFYTPEHDVLRISVPVEKAPFTEWMQFNFSDRSVNKARLELQWEESKAGFSIQLDQNLIIENFANQLRNRQGFGHLAWREAAEYLLLKNFNLPQALAWADSSIKRERRFDNQYAKARILTKMDRSPDSETALGEALKSAAEADFSRVVNDQLREGNKAKALAVASQGTKAFPASWMTQFAAARAFAENNDVKAARKAAETALKTAPDARKATISEFISKLK